MAELRAAAAAAAALLVGLLALPGALGAPAIPADAHPLLDYADSLPISALPDETAAREDLRSAQRQLLGAKPPGDGCNVALGARRYAALYRDVAMANEALGDYGEASRDMQHALQCAPRDASYQAAYAGQLLALRRYDEARLAIARGRDVAPTDLELRSVLLRVSLAQRRWDEAAALAGALVDDDTEGEHWIYWQLLLRVAQERGGHVASNRPPAKSTDDWPMPLWQALAGQRMQSELLQQIRALRSDTVRRQQLCESLFYFGEQQLARGENETARLHFAAATRMKILNFIEHDLALAELEQFRAGRQSAAPR